MKYVFKCRYLYLGFLIVALTACGGSSGGSGPAPATPRVCPGGLPGVPIFWDESRESAVNAMLGGYVVYYSLNTGFAIGDTGVTSQPVPYVSGASAPTCAFINPAAGTWFVRVTATTPLNAPGTAGGSESAASPEISVVVP